MAAGSEITALALSALFEFCVPGVSQGRLEQRFSATLIVPLTDSEKTLYAGAIKDDDTAFRIKSDAGIILMTTKGGVCRVITAEGDTKAAAKQFRQKLTAAGGMEEQSPRRPADGYEQISGAIH